MEASVNLLKAVCREMKAKIHETSMEVEALWRASPHTPPKPSHCYRQHSSILPPTPTSVKTCWESERTSLIHLPRANSKRAASSPVEERDFKFEIKSPRLEDETQGIINEMLADLGRRGKGEYTCPLGNRCRKGGISNGELFVFKRNSAFR